ncbi:alpha/beta hydrolase [Cellulomonas sp. APG4]|uniref:alpha/beta hydrolase n=1 Tax=Cellulomonas sp. APG4 TaxID=1538656 RepID=UPI0013795CFA|nr:alpha/beta hydrolase [Cellulomonas sp. APG4]NCT92486.1 alpha/beta hydrolase [Cellulomonas sp. APG4]
MSHHTSAAVTAPPLDPESAAALALQMMGDPSPITADDVPLKRAEEQAAAEATLTVLDRRGLVRRDHAVRSFDGVEVTMSVIHRKDRIRTSPLVYYVHGGGMMLGNRWSGADTFLDWIDRYNAVVATIEYRLAPEHAFPTPQEDCYAGLLWLEENAGELGLNVETGLIAGISAGGGLAAAVTLMARDRGGPRVGGQLLLAPMLDDRNDTVSARQYPTGLWNAAENELGWRSLLGDLHGSDAVPAHAAPSRATDLGGLPPAFVEVGSAEVFRDEAVTYAQRIWACGGQAELHVWAGGFHGFQTLSHTAISRGSLQALHSWMDRALGFTGRQ